MLQPMLVLSPVRVVVVAVVVVHVCTILVCKMYILLVHFKEGVLEKSTLCTLVKMEIIMDDTYKQGACK